MLIAQVDAFGIEALERRFDGSLDVRGLAVEATPLTGDRIDFETELGRDHHLLAHRP